MRWNWAFTDDTEEQEKFTKLFWGGLFLCLSAATAPRNLLGLVSISSPEILSFLRAKSLDLVPGLQWQLKWKLSISCGCIIQSLNEPALKCWYGILGITLEPLESISYPDFHAIQGLLHLSNVMGNGHVWNIYFW